MRRAMPGMRRAATIALLLLVIAPAAALAATPRTTLPDVEDEVMCVECGTSLALSQAPVADQERAFIRREIAQGKTKAQIKADLVEEYGQAVLAEPDDGGFGLAAWWVPVVLVPLAALGAALAARRWRRRAAAAPATPGAGSAPAPLDPAEARRLDAELAAFDP
jgi:cytochrome c-type biogenesis protein CcmH